ncbi:MAG: hypothetical protein RR334_03595, partial [Clostridia bacterium]
GGVTTTVTSYNYNDLVTIIITPSSKDYYINIASVMNTATLTTGWNNNNSETIIYESITVPEDTLHKATVINFAAPTEQQKKDQIQPQTITFNVLEDMKLEVTAIIKTFNINILNVDNIPDNINILNVETNHAFSLKDKPVSLNALFLKQIAEFTQKGFAIRDKNGLVYYFDAVEGTAKYRGNEFIKYFSGVLQTEKQDSNVTGFFHNTKIDNVATTEGMTFDLDRNITIQGLYAPCDEYSVTFMRYDSTLTQYDKWKKFIAWKKGVGYAPNCSSEKCVIDGLPVISSAYLPINRRIISWVYTLNEFTGTEIITSANKDRLLPGNLPLDVTEDFKCLGKLFAYAVYADDSFVINSPSVDSFEAVISRDNLSESDICWIKIDESMKNALAGNIPTQALIESQSALLLSMPRGVGKTCPTTAGMYVAVAIKGGVIMDIATNPIDYNSSATIKIVKIT